MIRRIFVLCLFWASLGAVAVPPLEGERTVGQLRANAASTVLTIPFVEIKPGSFTGIAASNPSDQPMAIRYTAYDAQGNMIGFPNNPAELMLPAGTQDARRVEEIFEVDENAQPMEQVGWVEVSSDNPQIGSFFQVGTLDLRQLDGSVAFEQQASRLYLGRIFEGPAAFQGQSAHTSISVVNPNSEPVELLLTLHNTGLQIDPLMAALPARGMLYGTISELFGDGSPLEASTGYLEVEVASGPGAVGFEIIQLEEQSTVIGLNASLGNAFDHAVSAQAAANESIFTHLNLINASSATRTVRLDWLAFFGNRVVAPVEVTLQPGEQLSQDAAELFKLAEGLGPNFSLIGTLLVDVDGDGVIGDVIFGDPDSLAFAAALPLQSQPLDRAVFNQVGEVPGVLFTGLAFFNPAEEGAILRIQVFQPDGTLAADMGDIVLVERNRISLLLSELIEGVQGQAGGYILVSSDFPIYMQLIFGGLDGNGATTFFSAVPPSVID